MQGSWLRSDRHCAPHRRVRTTTITATTRINRFRVLTALAVAGLRTHGLNTHTFTCV